MKVALHIRALLVLFAVLRASKVKALPFLLRASHSLEFSAGVRLHFDALPETAYCIITDACAHVNVLAGSGQAPVSWVQAVGILAGGHSLEFSAHVLPSTGQAALSRLLLDGADAADSLADGEGVRTSDGALSVEPISTGPEFLVTLPACPIRLLVRIRTVTTSLSNAEPHLTVDVLDWQNLHSPHGLVGQLFPHRAPSHAFPTASTAVSTRPLGGNGISDRLLDTVARLRAAFTSSTLVAGVPGDYQTSSLTAADCAFSQTPAEGPRAETPTSAGPARPELSPHESTRHQPPRASLSSLPQVGESTTSARGNGPHVRGVSLEGARGQEVEGEDEPVPHEDLVTIADSLL